MDSRTAPEEEPGRGQSESAEAETHGRDSAQTRVVDALRHAIASGSLAPRSQVSESALAAKFGTSRTPIREALKQLQAEGLVKIIPRVGTFVTEPSWQEIVELSQVKEMLEALAARLVAQRSDPAVIAVLEANIEASQTAVERGDIEAYVTLVREFHDALVRAANNQKLLAHHRILMNQFSYNRLVFSSLQQPGRLPSSLDEHAVIVRAIVARDADAAELSMRTHANQSRRALAASMLASSDGPTGELMLRSGIAGSLNV